MQTESSVIVVAAKGECAMKADDPRNTLGHARVRGEESSTERAKIRHEQAYEPVAVLYTADAQGRKRLTTQGRERYGTVANLMSQLTSLHYTPRQKLVLEQEDVEDSSSRAARDIAQMRS